MYPLKCASCGAPLSVPKDAETFACRHCGSEQKVVRRGDTVTLAASVQAIESSAQRVASELAIQRLDKELAQVFSTYSLEHSLQEHRIAVAATQYNLERPQEPAEFTLDGFAGWDTGEAKFRYYAVVVLEIVILVLFVFFPKWWLLVIGLSLAIAMLGIPAVRAHLRYQAYVLRLPADVAAERQRNLAALAAAKASLAPLEAQEQAILTRRAQLQAERQTHDEIVRKTS